MCDDEKKIIFLRVCMYVCVCVRKKRCECVYIFICIWICVYVKK